MQVDLPKMVDKSRRTFLTNTLLTSSVLTVTRRVEAQNTNALAFQRIAIEETFTIPEVQDARRALFERDPDREPGLPPPPYVVNDTVRTLYDLGDGRITAMDAVGGDSPVASSERGTEWMDAAPVSDADRRKIYQENAERIFSL
jgi:hypothetical protein